MKLSLLDLPLEILSEILTHLDHLSILRSSAVCKQLHALVTSSLLLQYRIELAADGLVDGPPGGPASTTAARMELLLERRAAWRALRPSRRAAVALAGHCHAYELVGGLFAKALEEFGAARRLVASWLPSNAAGETRLVVDDLGVRIKDFALDPAQDLIVLLEHRPAVGPIASTSSSAAAADIRVHLRKLSAGAVAPHPAARNPVLCRHGLGPVHGCMIQIVEDVVGMYFWMPFHGVLIWNWMTGEELVFIQDNQAPDRIWDFSFLSPRVHMVTTLKDGGEIRIYSFANSSSPKRAAARRDARVHVFTLHHDPAAQLGRWRPACFVVHNRTLTQYVDVYREEVGAADEPWEHWGPNGTRFFVLAIGFQWLRYVHGTRVVCPVLQPTGESRAEVLDSNVHASRALTAGEKLAATRLGIDPERPLEGARLVREPSVYHRHLEFSAPEMTQLRLVMSRWSVVLALLPRTNMCRNHCGWSGAMNASGAAGPEVSRISSRSESLYEAPGVEQYARRRDLHYKLARIARCPVSKNASSTGSATGGPTSSSVTALCPLLQ
ncbi:hypothetical protein F5148DRAFT_1151976 [Russula earlei]|uniref:Uncharacterized protein n=1 Tax=Russula earlei TaxID=71964 RepID=A0ACC0U0H8_9AGAM|nr:hypothetical protein F5148DRAFT_1151976 [Russula earlei]